MRREETNRLCLRTEVDEDEVGLEMRRSAQMTTNIDDHVNFEIADRFSSYNNLIFCDNVKI